MPSINVKGSDENIIEKVLVLQPNVSAEDLQTIQEYVVSATATRISDLEAQVDTLEPIIQNIDTSEANAKASEDNAKISEDNAEDYSLKSKSYAVGTNNTYRAGDATDNAEYYKNQCEAIASSLAGALRPMGTIAFANLPALSTADVGDMYNISDDFVTTSDFTVGAGISYPAGSNVYKIQSDKWDVLVGSSVIGVKGDAESNYRKGNINITPANIGAYSKSEIDNTVSGLATKTSVDNLVVSKADSVDLGEVTATSAQNAIGGAWDKLNIYDKPVVVNFRYYGQFVGILFKYTSLQYGMGIAIKYDGTSIYTLSVNNGVKSYSTK